MSRYVFASSRRAVIVAVTFIALPLVACRFFVDLDGLGDGVRPADATTTTDGPGGDVEAGEGGGPDGDAGADGDAAIKPCPGSGGPKPVRISEGNVSFCIDSTEVSRAQYKAFLATNPPDAGQPARCAAWNASYVPTCNWPPSTAEDDLPVGCVDWCDAYAFCKWAGKRLCGKIGGGLLDLGTAQDPTQAEYMFACTKGGTRTYPYGSTYNPTACNGADLGVDKPEAVGARSTCEGGFAGIYDLAGNAHEWMDGCENDEDAGFSDICSIQGTSWSHPTAEMFCTRNDPDERQLTIDEVGFRCCSD